MCALGEAKGSTQCTQPIPVDVTSGCGPRVELDPADIDVDATVLEPRSLWK